MNLEIPYLPNVHEVLAEAVTELSAHEPLVTGTFKVRREVKAMTQKICARHGTDMSSFLRKCCEALVRGYVE